jgi:arylsulfatase A-like enzyme
MLTLLVGLRHYRFKYPNSTKPGVDQYALAIDLVATVMDSLGVVAPDALRGVAQAPIEGVSFAATFDEPTVESEHKTRYFEMLGHRAIDHDGWRAVNPLPGPDFTTAETKGSKFGSTISLDVLNELETDGWELYNITDDPTESRNVGPEHPAKFRELIAMWWVEAGKYKVLPLDGEVTSRLAVERP